MRFIYFDEANPVPEADPGAIAGEDSGQDYNQLIYEYLVSKDEVDYKYILESINNNLEWTNALLLLMVTLYLMNCCRRWISKLTGGVNNVS